MSAAPLTAEEVAAALALCDRATPGPWHDARFLAAARDILPRALRDLQATRAALSMCIVAINRIEVESGSILHTALENARAALGEEPKP